MVDMVRHETNEFWRIAHKRLKDRVKRVKYSGRRRTKYTCRHLTRDYETKDGICEALSDSEFPVRCVSVPLTECPFVPVSVKTGKELKPRYA